MPTKFEDKTFYGCTVSEKSLDDTRRIKRLSLPDMFRILLHNQTIINDKLSQLLKK